MKQVLTYAILAAATLSATESSATFARFSYQTAAVNNSVFEVIPRGRDDVDGYWCAASDYARRTLGAGWQQPIYVVRGYGPSEATGRKTAVQFSLQKPSGVTPPQRSFVTSGFVPGTSVSVQGAYARCNINIIND